MSKATNSSETSELASISLSARIPDFWPDQPRLWFIQVEAILAQQKAGDYANYNIVVAKLNKEVIQQVADILADPPEIGKFDTLKTRLLEIYEESESRQIQKLISEMELGDQRPSQLLRRMRELARSKINDETLTILWQGHLPSSVRAVLAVTATKDLDKLAIIADRIMETYKPAGIAEVTQNAPSSSSSTDTQAAISALSAEIAKLNVKIDKMERSRSRSRSRRTPQSRHNSASRGRTRRTPESPDWLCQYHYKFRSRARKCTQPCSWKKTEN